MSLPDDVRFELWKQEREAALDQLEILWRMRKCLKPEAAPRLVREFARIRRRMRRAENEIDAIHPGRNRLTHPVRGWSEGWTCRGSFLRAWVDRIEVPS